MTIYKLLRARNSLYPNRRLLFLLAGFFLIVTPFCTQRAAAQTGGNEKWLGNYTFEDSARPPKRRRFTDMVPSSGYDITVEKDANDKLTATLTESGVQVYQAYECSVKTRDGKIEFYYQKFVAPNVKDLKRFRKGDLLFTLAETKVGKKTKYLFQPAAYRLVRYEKSRQKQPVYFKKL